MFLAVLFVVAPNLKQPKCLSTAVWINSFVVYLCKEIALSNKIECTVDTYNKNNESQHNYAKGITYTPYICISSSKVVGTAN